MNYTTIGFILGCFVTFGVMTLWSAFTAEPAYCLQYYDHNSEPVYNLNCIMEEAARQEVPVEKATSTVIRPA